MYPFAGLLVIVFFRFSLPLAEGAILNVSPPNDTLHGLREHSTENIHEFDPRDGWQTVNITNLHYKYSRVSPQSGAITNNTKLPQRPSGRLLKKPAAPRVSQMKPEPKKNGIGATVKGLVHDIASMVGLGPSQPVTITWYTGHDLENPSCWSNSDWTPTDQSMVAALTEEGWEGKPGCFKFLELCNSAGVCVFVRVVDTCAGCARGSKHVDLTKEAFTRLAALEEGILTVQMRSASEPKDWDRALWGPQTV
ncbi:hypothetical protein BJ138DRAFT_1176072 [Hygrophoropsis aurantiaca]|uniref:Uncharacterized protein n=1 Tax=Hygrophoropsis aurantiaca TaxID=72124 RepID=A0ACB8ASM5_9AGAM|nr:hypothetical protein BJ138DRAFT_1176072 [Hygrophoropsis aurantiaca]